MAKTDIEWTDHVWNPTRGCSIVSSGCKNCYAMGMAARFSEPGQWGHGFARWSKNRLPQWTGEVALVPEKLAQPLHWRKPRRIFVNSTSDLFHEKLSDEEIAAVFGVMAACPQHIFQVLTKRATRLPQWFAWLDAQRGIRTRPGLVIDAAIRAGARIEIVEQTRLAIHQDTWPLPNVHLGVSVEDQQRADERIPELLKTPAAVRFISAEPLLNRVTIRSVGACPVKIDALTGRWDVPRQDGSRQEPRVHWVIVGGESGIGARPFNLAWSRSIRDQCKATGVPFFCKQLGARPVGVVIPLRDRHGGNMAEWPEDLRIREFPSGAAPDR